MESMRNAMPNPWLDPWNLWWIFERVHTPYEHVGFLEGYIWNHMFSWWDDHHDRNNRNKPNFTMAQLYIINYYKYIKYVCIYIYVYYIYIYISYILNYIMYTQGNIYIYIMTFYPHYCWLHRHSERWYKTCKNMTIETLLIVSNFPADRD